MKASHIAYLAYLVEKAPSTYREKAELLEELQRIYRATQERRYGPSLRVPVMVDLTVEVS